jgi:alpha-glucosidase (family GH31 glycosyl hydrolase)
MPESNIHRGDADIGGVQNHSYYHNVYFCSLVMKVANDSGIRAHIFSTSIFIYLSIYNFQVYGMLMTRSTYKGMEMANAAKRPFVLTRAGFIGSQRYAATWTGDNLSTWEHLHMSLPMILQLVIETFVLCFG